VTTFRLQARGDRAIRIALYGIATADDLDDLRGQFAPPHPPHDTSPGQVLLELAADAIEGSGSSWAQVCTVGLHGVA
jgi:hypothetical protein